MKLRKIGTAQVPEIGLGCMNLSHAYGVPPSEEEATRLLHKAIDLGIRHFDTAALYGFGANEILLGKALKQHRKEIHLASKCGMTGVNGQRVIDGRPETLRATIEESLCRLQTEFIDLYYLHRWDKSVPIEDSVGELSRMVDQGKIGAIGLSEVSANTLRKAHAVHPVTAVQSEYSLWSRNVEVAVLDTCKKLGATFVAFSPLGRGFLADGIKDPADFVENDIRRNMPRFQSPNFEQNSPLMDEFRALARETGFTPGQLALKWVLDQGNHIVAIPGTRSIEHLEEDVSAAAVSVSTVTASRMEAIFDPARIRGHRYALAGQREVDTEELS